MVYNCLNKDGQRLNVPSMYKVLHSASFVRLAFVAKIMMSFEVVGNRNLSPSKPKPHTPVKLMSSLHFGSFGISEQRCSFKMDLQEL